MLNCSISRILYPSALRNSDSHLSSPPPSDSKYLLETEGGVAPSRGYQCSQLLLIVTVVFYTFTDVLIISKPWSPSHPFTFAYRYSSSLRSFSGGLTTHSFYKHFSFCCPFIRELTPTHPLTTILAKAGTWDRQWYSPRLITEQKWSPDFPHPTIT